MCITDLRRDLPYQLDTIFWLGRKWEGVVHFNLLLCFISMKFVHLWLGMWDQKHLKIVIIYCFIYYCSFQLRHKETQVLYVAKSLWLLFHFSQGIVTRGTAMKGFAWPTGQDQHACVQRDTMEILASILVSCAVTKTGSIFVWPPF